MAKFIHLIDGEQRDAEVTFGSLNPKSKVRLGLPDGTPVENRRVLKATSETLMPALLERELGPAEGEGEEQELLRAMALSEKLIEGDPEIDMELHGRYVSQASRVYVDAAAKPVFGVKRTERIYGPDRALKEERVPKVTLSNISETDMVRWSGKMLPKAAVASKVLLTKKYQIRHINGLTFDFLFGLAKSLADKESLMPVGAGEKGTDPLVMSDGGKPYRAFLEGRIKGESYCLILHLTDQELKAPQPAAS